MINYGTLFAEYKKVIILGLQRGLARWIELIQWYNTEVFAWQNMQQKDDTNNSDVEEALQVQVDEDSDDNGLWNEISYINNNDDADADDRVRTMRKFRIRLIFLFKFIVLGTSCR